MKSKFHLSFLPIFVLFVTLGSCREKPVPITPDTIEKEPVQYGVPFDKVPLVQDIVMYEINVRAFSPSGDLQGVIDRIDSIRKLGVNVIWLMPIHPIGQLKSVNSPYCVRNYKEVNPEFGGLDDLRALVDAAHSRDMAVIIDWVANHSSWDNPWISHPSWYTKVNGEIVHPPGTNWQDVADLNFFNQDMRLAMVAAMKYWALEANIDGFRCDAADFVPFSFWKQAIDSLSGLPGRSLILLAEGERADHFTAGFQMNYSWAFYSKLKDVFNGVPASTLAQVHVDEYKAIPSGGEKLRFTTNHDESAWDATPVTLFKGKTGAMAASVITAYMGGVPMIYGSQEVGRATNVPFFYASPIDWSQNRDMEMFYRQLFAIYHQIPALKTGQLTTYAHDDVVAFLRSGGSEKVLVLVNVRPVTTVFTMPAELQQTNWVDAFTAKSTSIGVSVELEPYGYRVLTQ
ncbi:MAG: alpha-amylase family glycosyl hydrolase [Cyclobacteriaceae bacterium]|nr:alpha-amylase family glycosyl hydrolase [Cyclobacteriaceae bacterium]